MLLWEMVMTMIGFSGTGERPLVQRAIRHSGAAQLAKTQEMKAQLASRWRTVRNLYRSRLRKPRHAKQKHDELS